MRKIILLIVTVTASFFFLSCKKEKVVPPANNQSIKRKITLNVSGFTESTGPVTHSISKNNKLIINDVAPVQNSNLLFYVLLDSTNTVIKTVKQTVDISDNATFNDSLLPGTYYVAFLAGTNNTGPKGVSLTYNNNGLFNFGSNPGWGDLFFAKTKLVVSDQDVSLNSVLDRIVAQVEVNVLDAVPPKVTDFRVSFTELNQYFSVITGAFVKFQTNYPGSRSNIAETAIVPGTSDNKLILYTANFSGSFPIDITCGTSLYAGTGNDNNLAIYKSGIPITCEKNKLTLVAGNLFSNGGKFNITVGDWDPSVTIPF